MPGFCETDDVRAALQEKNLSGPTDTDNVEPAIESVSNWLAKQGNRYWYDSGGGGTLVPSSPATASEVTLSVPSSPHAQDRQLYHNADGMRYPVTQAGPYARLPLPHGSVQSLTTLEVRERAGGTTDWVADSEHVQGRGEDYHLVRDDRHSYGRTYLHLRAASIGPRVDFEYLLTLEYDHGNDDPDDWRDVRRGVAQLAAAQVVVDDDVLTSIPDDGQLVGVDSQRQQLLDDAMDALEPYTVAPRGRR
jgi:hypothetical protein